jgi:hypothetical protein
MRVLYRFDREAGMVGARIMSWSWPIVSTGFGPMKLREGALRRFGRYAGWGPTCREALPRPRLAGDGLALPFPRPYRASAFARRYGAASCGSPGIRRRSKLCRTGWTRPTYRVAAKFSEMGVDSTRLPDRVSSLYVKVDDENLFAKS